jgi:hypothetical protein
MDGEIGGRVEQEIIINTQIHPLQHRNTAAVLFIATQHSPHWPYPLLLWFLFLLL